MSVSRRALIVASLAALAVVGSWRAPLVAGPVETGMGIVLATHLGLELEDASRTIETIRGRVDVRTEVQASYIGVGACRGKVEACVQSLATRNGVAQITLIDLASVGELTQIDIRLFDGVTGKLVATAGVVLDRSHSDQENWEAIERGVSSVWGPAPVTDPAPATATGAAPGETSPPQVPDSSADTSLGARVGAVSGVSSPSAGSAFELAPGDPSMQTPRATPTPAQRADTSGGPLKRVIWIGAGVVVTVVAGYFIYQALRPQADFDLPDGAGHVSEPANLSLWQF